MIKIISAISNPVGGSTIALLSLWEEFNRNKMPTTLYFPADTLDQIYQLASDDLHPLLKRISTLSEMELSTNDVVISHNLDWPYRPDLKKLILTCHETDTWIVKNHKQHYDHIHYVSEFQKQWQGVDGTVIPNIVRKLTKKTNFKKTGIAGIIGNITPHKQTHLSIQRALDDGFEHIEIWGQFYEQHLEYYDEKIKPLLGNNIKCFGAFRNPQEVYDRVDCVYHSSLRETFNLVQAECLKTGVEYRGLPENTMPHDTYEFDNAVIVEKWKLLMKDL